ncbi:MAG: hypothetical protein ACK58T_34925 [Phycisphaerae bacterium]
MRIQHQRTAVEAPLRIGDDLAVRDDGHAIGAQLDDDRLAGALERPLVALPLAATVRAVVGAVRLRLRTTRRRRRRQRLRQ